MQTPLPARRPLARKLACVWGQVLHRNIFPAKTYRVIGQNQPPEQTPLPSRHLLLGEGCAIAVWAESPKADVAPSARAGLFRGAVARRSGLPSAARMLATSCRPPDAPFAVQTRPPCAPLSRGIPGQPRPAGLGTPVASFAKLSFAPSAPGLGLASAPARG